MVASTSETLPVWTTDVLRVLRRCICHGVLRGHPAPSVCDAGEWTNVCTALVAHAFLTTLRCFADLLTTCLCVHQDGDYLDVVEPGVRMLWAAAAPHPAFVGPSASASTQYTVGGDVTPVAVCEAA